MFVSPCRFRSSQCAALIALAAAAGIARIAPPPAADGPRHVTPMGEVKIFATYSPTAPFAALAPPDSAWAYLFLTVTASRLVAASDLPAPPALLPAVWPTSDVAARQAESLLPAPPMELSTRGRQSPADALSQGCSPHVLPFAVGPPGCAFTPTPTAAGARAPGNSAATRLTAPQVAAPDEASSLPSAARPARPLASRRRLSGPATLSRFALRGNGTVTQQIAFAAKIAPARPCVQPTHSHA